MEAEKTAEASAVSAEKPAEAPTIKLDDVRPKKVEAAPATPAAPKSAKKAAPKAAPAAEAAKPPVRLVTPPKPEASAGVRALDFAERHGYRAAGVLVVLGLGWIIGANSFDNHANERRVAEALRALDTKIEMVSAKVVTGSEVAALKRNLDDLKPGLESARKSSAAIGELRSRFEASERTRTASADALMERVSERVASMGKEQGERLDKLADRLDAIEKQLSSQIPTASIPTSTSTSASSSTPHAAEPVQVPGVTMPMAQPRNEGRTAVERSRVPENGYVLREVYNGIALVEGRRGLLEVGPGDTLPGAGRVRSIERRNRQWVVVTSNGVIDTNGY